MKHRSRQFTDRRISLRTFGAPNVPAFETQLGNLAQQVAELQREVTDLKTAMASLQQEPKAPPAPTIHFFTLREFLQRHRMSRSAWYALQKAGLGPRISQMGRVIRISLQAETEWLEKMEKPTH